MTDYYAEGFITKCAEAGVDPEELLKQANLSKILHSIGRFGRGVAKAPGDLMDELGAWMGHGTSGSISPDKATALGQLTGAGGLAAAPIYAALKGKSPDETRLGPTGSPELNRLSPYLGGAGYKE